MKYTKEQLQAMSDFEVNKALLLLTLEEDDLPVSWASGVEFYEDCGSIFQDSEEVGDYGRYVDTSEIDYCNTANDIMPLAFEHDIAYLRTYKTAYCKIDGQKHKQHYTDESPLRAIACCLILVLQGEK